MSTVRQLRPWTDVVRPHPDVASGDLAMGTYAANLAAVAYVTGNAPLGVHRCSRVLRVDVPHARDAARAR